MVTFKDSPCYNLTVVPQHRTRLMYDVHFTTASLSMKFYVETDHIITT